MVNAIIARSSLQAARMAVPRQALTQQVRGAHFENKVYHTLPFPAGPKNKTGVAIGITAFFVTSASLPLVAIGYQMLK